MEQPIIILTAPRSGSSMTAGIFAQHGVWVGRCRPGNEYNPKGFFENQDVKNKLKRCFGILKDFKDVYNEGFRPFVEEIAPREGPWLVKHGALYWTAWRDFNPKYILVRRPRESVYKSGKAVRFNHSREFIDACIKQLDYVEKHHNGINIYTEDIIKGDYNSLENAFDKCGLQLNQRIVNDFVEPTFWHY